MKSPTACAGHNSEDGLKWTILKIAAVQIAVTCLILWLRADLLRPWEASLRVIDPYFRVFTAAEADDSVFWLWFALVAGLPLVIPWHVYFAIRHVHPDLPPKRRFSLIAVLGASLLVFLAGFWVANSWFLPAMLESLESLGNIENRLRI